MNRHVRTITAMIASRGALDEDGVVLNSSVSNLCLSRPGKPWMNGMIDDNDRGFRREVVGTRTIGQIRNTFGVRRKSS